MSSLIICGTVWSTSVYQMVHNRLVHTGGKNSTEMQVVVTHTCYEGETLNKSHFNMEQVKEPQVEPKRRDPSKDGQTNRCLMYRTTKSIQIIMTSYLIHVTHPIYNGGPGQQSSWQRGACTTRPPGQRGGPGTGQTTQQENQKYIQVTIRGSRRSPDHPDICVRRQRGDGEVQGQLNSET